MRRLLLIAATAMLVMACKKDAKKDDGTQPAAGSGSAAMMAPPADPTAKADDTPTPTEKADPGTPPSAPPSAPPSDPSMAPPPSGARPPAVTDAMVAVADKLVAAMNDLGTQLTAAAGDCKKATVALNGAVKTFTPIAAEAEKMREVSDKDQAVNDWFQANYMEKMMTAFKPLMEIGQKCGSDKAFTDALQKLPLPGQKKAAP